MFFDELDAGAFLCNVGNDCGEVLEGAGEAVDAVDAEGVAFSDVVEGVGKSGAFCPRGTRKIVGERFVDYS